MILQVLQLKEKKENFGRNLSSVPIAWKDSLSHFIYGLNTQPMSYEM